MTSILTANSRASDAARADPPVHAYDSYDSLTGGSDDRREMLGRKMLTAVKPLVAARDDTAAKGRHVGGPPSSDDLPLTSANPGLERDRAGRSRRRHDGWPNPSGPGLTVAAVTAADAHPNIVIRGEAASSLPTPLLRWWATGRCECVVIDIDGRYGQIDLQTPGGWYFDVAHVSADQLRAVLCGRHRVSVLDFSQVPAAFLSTALGRALSVIAAHRARTGHPHWMMIDDAETVLSDPDIPPHVLDLTQRGHCLVMRSTDGLPDSLAASIDIIVDRGCSDDD